MLKAHSLMHVTCKAVLVDPRGRVLFLRDSGQKKFHKNAKGYWDYPGGRMRGWESPLEALAREVVNETGIQIEVNQARLFHHAHWTLDGEAKNGQMVALFFIVPIPESAVTLSLEHDRYLWIDPHQLLPRDIAGSAARILDIYREHENIRPFDKRLQDHQGYGLIQVIHGSGKGKTTAALGQAIRCAGAGRRVAIIYFDKGGDDHYHEREIIAGLDNIDYWATGRDRIDAKTGRFDFSLTEQDRAEARRGLKLAEQALSSGEYDLVVLDEINPCLNLHLLELDDVLNLLDGKNQTTEIILTGREAPSAVLERAHLISKVDLGRHYFYSGVQARPGLDY